MLILAAGVPPAAVVAVVFFAVCMILSVRDKDWKLGCLAVGLAALAWPW